MSDRGNREPSTKNALGFQKQIVQRDSAVNLRSVALPSSGTQGQYGTHQSDEGWCELIAQMERDAFHRMKNQSPISLRNLYSLVTKN
jgi:hypothetical protein